MDKQSTEYYEAKFAEYKRMVELRQDECEHMGNLLEEEANDLSSRGKLFKTILYIVGALVAAKSALELAMLNMNVSSNVMSIVSIVFLLLGVVIIVISKLQGDSKYEEKAGKLRVLSSPCKSSSREFMSDYLQYVDHRNPEMTLTNLKQLIDLQEKKLDDIRKKSDKLDVDLSSINISYRIDGREEAI